MKKLAACLFAVLMLACACAQAEDADVIVTAIGDGVYNIPFDSGYHGYDIDYVGEQAYKGDRFTIQDLSSVENNNSGMSVANEIKAFVVEYYDEFIKDEIRTQHIIWHFTDDFNGWRVDPELMEEIKATAAKKMIPDHGAVKQISDTQEAVFDFCMYKAQNPWSSDYFAYKVTVRDIVPGSGDLIPDDGGIVPGGGSIGVIVPGGGDEEPEEDAMTLPGTGDETPLALYAALLMISAAALAVLRRRAVR